MPDLSGPMNLFDAVPALHRHSLLAGKDIRVVGASTIAGDPASLYFEIGKPKYWRTRADGSTIVGLGGIGGTLEHGESAVTCLRREVQEELGARVRFEVPPVSFVIRDWSIVDAIVLPASKKRLPPLMVILVPPRLGGPGTPDHLAILAYRTWLRGAVRLGDLFGLLRIQRDELRGFFGRDQMPLSKALAWPGVAITLSGEPPSGAVLRPILTARAFQLLVRAGHVETPD